MGYPMAGHLARGRAPRHRLQPHRGEGRAMGRRARRQAARRRRPRRRAAPRSSSPASATTTTCARWRSATSGAFAGMKRRRDLRRPHDGLGRGRARARRGRGRARAALRRRAGLGRQPRRHQRRAHRDVRRRRSGVRGGQPVAMAFAKAMTLLGPSGSGQLAKMVNQIAIAGLRPGPVGGDRLRRALRARHEGGARASSARARRRAGRWTTAARP